TFANVTVYQPDDAYTQVTYARTENLPNITILSVFSDSSANSSISTYRSKDNGFSWYAFGTVTSDVAGRRLTQPHLLYTTEAFGEYDGGTVLLAVNAVDDNSTNVEIYASGDGGESWDFVSRVVSGGKPNNKNGATPVWEPFLVAQDRKLTVYYSDQSDRKYAQKISHRTTTSDLDSWAIAVDDVTSQVYTDQPGSPTVAKLGNGNYILTFSYALLNTTRNEYTFPVYYKIASTPEGFTEQPIRMLAIDNGVQPNGSPFVTWSPLGGTNGTIVVSASDSSSVYLNQKLGEGTWKEVKTPAGRAYSREVRIPDNDSTKLRFAGGAEFGKDTPSQILVTIMDLEKALKA
ncbi:glycoside hydrolase family 93 protein, partial [Pleomassaria siparia CBS 279.74]